MNVQDFADGTIIRYAKRRYVVTRSEFDPNKKILVYIDRAMTGVYPDSWKKYEVIFNPNDTLKVKDWPNMGYN